MTLQPDTASGEIARIGQRLDKTDYLAKAPEHVIEESREHREELNAAAARLNAALRMLG